VLSPAPYSGLVRGYLVGVGLRQGARWLDTQSDAFLRRRFGIGLLGYPQPNPNPKVASRWYFVVPSMASLSLRRVAHTYRWSKVFILSCSRLSAPFDPSGWVPGDAGCCGGV